MKRLPLPQTPIIDLGDWLQQPAGAYISAWEQTQFAGSTADIFGFHALQIGLPQLPALTASRMPHQWISVSSMPATGSQLKISLVHDFAELPFDSQSIDLVILPHVLEFAAEPHQILREVERVLIPEGRVIITGLNRTSLWGLRQFFGKRTGHPFLPEEGEFISPHRLKDWLKLLSMEVEETRYGCYALPVDSAQWLQNSGVMEGLGRRWWPRLGAVYMLEAVKRVRGMHLVGPALKRKRLRRAHAVPVANKGGQIE
ncbi:MAG: methyltransferase domain-containing protein [Burkholderiales bacterium]|nr:methyltransferase domain-containing protein [Burkholderiales bacterium]